MIGKQINLGSPKQLQVVLFDELEMPKTKRTKTGYTTDADALQSLFDKTGHPFLQHLFLQKQQQLSYFLSVPIVVALPILFADILIVFHTQERPILFDVIFLCCSS